MEEISFGQYFCNQSAFVVIRVLEKEKLVINSLFIIYGKTFCFNHYIITVISMTTGIFIVAC